MITVWYLLIHLTAPSSAHGSHLMYLPMQTELACHAAGTTLSTKYRGSYYKVYFECIPNALRGVDSSK